MTHSPLDPYATLVVLSFGGPEAPEEVMPFLRRVTAGRGVPDDRLAEVAEHYYHFGGASPINAQNRALVDALSRELADRGIDRPVLLANRNSPPYVADVLAGLGDARVLVVITSLLQGYSSCRQYREDLGMGSVGLPVRIDKLPAYGAHPGVRSAMARLVADSVTAAAQADPDGRLHLICVAHSIPESADESSGRPDQGGRAYSAGVHALADAVAAVGLADTVERLGPLPAPPPPGPRRVGDDPPPRQRILLRTGHEHALDLADALRAMRATRSARKEPETVHVVVGPRDAVV